MEPRAAIGEYDLATGDYTLYTTSQNPHVIRLLMGAFVLQHSGEQAARRGARRRRRLRLEDLSTTPRKRSSPGRAGKLRRPVKWTAERTESLHVGRARPRPRHHRGDGARRERQVPRAAGPKRWPTWAPIFRPSRPAFRPICTPRCWPACTRRPRDLLRGEGGVHQHRAGGRLSRRRPAGGDVPARTAGGKAAHETGIDRVELRRQNFIPPSRSPTRLRSRWQYDSGDYQTTLNAALKLADYAAFPQRRAAAKAKGKLRGIGVSTYIEACGIAPSSRGGLARRPRGPLRSGQGPRPSHRQRDGVHRHPQPRPGPRDHVRAAGGRQARRRR